MSCENERLHYIWGAQWNNYNSENNTQDLVNIAGINFFECNVIYIN